MITAPHKDGSETAIRPLIVIPTYNNRATLRSVVEAVSLRRETVLVVNDGSTDESIDTLRGLSVTILNHSRNQGKGAAILTALEWAERHHFTHIITLDADGQHCPSDVSLFVERIYQNPRAVVVGNRVSPDRSMPRLSRFGRALSNFWLRVCTGIRLPDSQSGFRSYPVKPLRMLAFKGRRYDFEVEVLIRGAWSGVTLDSLDISVIYSESTKLGSHFSPVIDNYRITKIYVVSVIRSWFLSPRKLSSR